VVSSQAGKGTPEKKTAAAAASSTETDRKNSARIAVFASFLLVAAIRSAVSEKRSMEENPVSPRLPGVRTRSSAKRSV